MIGAEICLVQRSDRVWCPSRERLLSRG